MIIAFTNFFLQEISLQQRNDNDDLKQDGTLSYNPHTLVDLFKTTLHSLKITIYLGSNMLTRTRK